MANHGENSAGDQVRGPDNKCEPPLSPEAEACIAAFRASRPERPKPRVEAGVPRQFGIGTLLVIAAMYAVLFAVLRALRAPVPATFLFGGFFTVIGLGQMLLFGGRHPRRASIVTGAVTMPLLVLGTMALEAIRGHAHGDMFCVFLGAAIYGAFMGYLAGMLIASVFLAGRGLDRWYGKRRRASRDAVDKAEDPWSHPGREG